MDQITFKPEPDGSGRVGIVRERGTLELISSATLSANEFRNAVDSYLREMVAKRLNDLGVEAMVEKELGRRVEVAVKAHAARIETDVRVSVQEAIRKRLVEVAQRIPLEIHFSSSVSACENAP